MGGAGRGETSKKGETERDAAIIGRGNRGEGDQERRRTSGAQVEALLDGWWGLVVVVEPPQEVEKLEDEAGELEVVTMATRNRSRRHRRCERCH